MTETKPTLNKSAPKEAPKKDKYPPWQGSQNAELGVTYITKNGNLIVTGEDSKNG
jgi:hypothetical protein